MSKMLPVFMLVIACGLSGCGTIFNGASQSITITSEPEGASVRLNQHTTYTTPATLSLERKHDYFLEFTMDGHAKQTRNIEHRVSPVTFVNILIFPGFVVDALAGGMWQLEPGRVHVIMKPTAEAVATSPPDPN